MPRVGRGSSLCYGPSGIQEGAAATIGSTVVAMGAGSCSLCLEMTPAASAHMSLPKACCMAEHGLQEVGNYNPAGRALTLGEQ